MIRGDATPIGHRSPYKRIDPSHPCRKTVIWRSEIDRDGGREPDPAVYDYSYLLDRWTLKDGM